MSDLSPSIRKLIVDQLMLRLAGTADSPMPEQLGQVAINKNRGTAINATELPMYSVYFLHDVPTPVGASKYRPVLQNRAIKIEVRIIVQGTDDDADAHCVWVTQQIASADQILDVTGDGKPLALGVAEAETPFEPMEGSQSETTVTKIRFVIDYKTHPVDITRQS